MRSNLHLIEEIKIEEIYSRAEKTNDDRLTSLITCINLSIPVLDIRINRRTELTAILMIRVIILF